MAATALALPLINLGGEIIKRIFPDKEQQDKAKLALLAMEQEGAFKEIEVSMSAIVMEAQSQHKLVALARPSFLYVMYILILSAIPMGFFFAYDPVAAQEFVTGFRHWLEAIPAELWGMMTVGYLGYVNKREEGKARILGQEVKPGLLSKILG